MPSASGQNVATASSDSTSPPPACSTRSPRSRLAASPADDSLRPSHSSPTRRSPQSSRAATLNLSVSVLRRMPRVCGTSSITTLGGSSSRAVITSSSGAAPARPSGSRQASASLDSPSTTCGGVRITAPSTATVPPSSVAAASSRLAVATTVTRLPFTGAHVPPRMSCRRVPGRSRYSGSVTSASKAMSSGRWTAATRTRWRTSPAESTSC